MLELWKKIYDKKTSKKEKLATVKEMIKKYSKQDMLELWKKIYDKKTSKKEKLATVKEMIKKYSKQEGTTDTVDYLDELNDLKDILEGKADGKKKMDKKELEKLLEKDTTMMMKNFQAWVDAVMHQKDVYNELDLACHNLLSNICDRYGNDNFNCPYLQKIAELIKFEFKGEKNE